MEGLSLVERRKEVEPIFRFTRCDPFRVQRPAQPQLPIALHLSLRPFGGGSLRGDKPDFVAAAVRVIEEDFVLIGDADITAVHVEIIQLCDSPLI